MRILFKIVLLITLPASFLTASIDECKTDLYYANGIMMPDSEKDALKKWRKKAKSLLLSKPESYKKISEIKISYNISESFLADISESFEQVLNNEWGWETFTAYYEIFLATKNLHLDWDLHDSDLSNQVESYKESIKSGHGVIVLAHSQGNYYTNEAYEGLAEWMKAYFKMFGIATPANHVAGYEAGDTTAPYVKFHNDFIKSVITGLATNRENPNSEHSSIVSVAAHDFYDSYLTAENTKNEIVEFIEINIEEHSKASSQWETDEEFEIDTKDYRITVKHRFDPSVTTRIWEKVYPFQASKKLYQLKTGEYVKASCGGKGITSSWAGQKESEFWKIDNPEEEKIEGEVLIAPQQFLYQCRLIVQSPMKGSYYQGYSNRGVNKYNNRLYCQSFYPTKTTPLYKSVNFPIVSAPTAEEFNVLLDVEGKKLFTPLDAEVHEYLGSVFQNIQDTYGNNTYNILKYDKNPIECTMKWGGYTKLCSGRYTLSLERK